MKSKKPTPIRNTVKVAMDKRYGRTSTTHRHRNDRRAGDARKSWKRDHEKDDDPFAATKDALRLLNEAHAAFIVACDQEINPDDHMEKIEDFMRLCKGMESIASGINDINIAIVVLEDE